METDQQTPYESSSVVPFPNLMDRFGKVGLQCHRKGLKFLLELFNIRLQKNMFSYTARVPSAQDC